MKRHLLGTLGGFALLASGQSPATFDVATIKPTDPSNPAATATGFGLRGLTATGTLRDFVRLAYGVQDFQIAGTLSGGRYDIDARPAHPVNPAEMKVMLQGLLAQRFKLALHHEMRDLPVYWLEVQGRNSKLSSAAGTAGITAGPSLIRGNLSLADLARYLSQTVGRIVLDRTGLAGDFAIKLEWMPEEESVFTAIQEQLGLRLESTKAPVDVLVIDHSEPPSGN